MSQYDVAILGGGPGGYHAAERASQAGMSVVLFEKRALGGVCLNEGCIPSKTLLQSAKMYEHARHDGIKYGVTCEKVTLDHQAVIQRKEKVIQTLVSGVQMKMKHSKVKVVNALAKIIGRDAEAIRLEADGETYEARRLVLATGSQPVIPPIPGLQEGIEREYVLTSREILNLKEIPEKLVVIGAGVIGLEMVSYFNTAGSKVTVVEMLDKIAGSTEAEISVMLQKSYEKSGIQFELNAKVTSVDETGVWFERDGERIHLDADKILLSIGRRPSLEGYGLEKLNIAYSPKGIEIDDQCHTNITNVYAVGDCTGRLPLAHTAYRQAEVTVNNMIGKRDAMNYDAIPSVIYTSPEVAGVGLNEMIAEKKGIPVDVIKLPMMFSGRFVAENEGINGICKLLFHKTKHTLVGAHMIGNPASEIIFACSMMIEQQLTVEEIRRLVFPHPTVGEIIKEAVFAYQSAK